jgi:hypothetical protein
MTSKIKNDKWLEYGYSRIIKYGEELSGDSVEMKYNDDFTTIVLSDGLGSGVKANILSTITTKILSTMISKGIDIDECVSTLLNSLPYDKQKGAAYSTFSILHVNREGSGYLLEFDNPQAILVKNNKAGFLKREELMVCGNKVFKSSVKLNINDFILLFSDGVVHSGIGKSLKYGWNPKEICKFIDNNVTLDMSPIRLTNIINNYCFELSNGESGDDVTCIGLKLRNRVKINVMIGPPVDKNSDEKYVRDFLNEEGLKIVSGGTTANIVSKYLNKEIKVDMKTYNRDTPPIAYLSGIDLVTEGVITYRRLLENAKNYVSSQSLLTKEYNLNDGASILSNLLFETSTEIVFYLGQSINYSHRNYPIDITLKLKLVEQLAYYLKQIGKKVEIKYN